MGRRRIFLLASAVTLFLLAVTWVQAARIVQDPASSPGFADGTFLDTQLVVDGVQLKRPSWERDDYLPFRVSAASAAVGRPGGQETVYLLGGIGGGGTYRNRLHYARVDAVTFRGVLTWYTATASLPNPLALAALVITETGAGTTLYALGGHDGTSPQRGVRYGAAAVDGNVSAWQTGPDLPTAVYGHGAVAYRGRLYVAGGRTATGFNRRIWRAPILALGGLGGWVTETAALPVDAPYLALAAATVTGTDVLYLVVGNEGDGTATQVYYATLAPDGSLSPLTATAPLSRPLFRPFAFVEHNRLYVAGRDADTTVSPAGDDPFRFYYAPILPGGALGSWRVARRYAQDVFARFDLGNTWGPAAAHTPQQLFLLGGELNDPVLDGSNPSDNLFYTPILVDETGQKLLYVKRGTFVGAPFAFPPARVDRLAWQATVTNSALTLTLEYRVADDVAALEGAAWRTVGPSARGSAPITNVALLTTANRGRYLQYRALFEGDGQGTPILHRVAISYTPIPDLRLTKDDGVVGLQPGQRLTYTLRFTNVGVVTVTGAVLTDVLDPNLTFVAATPPPARTAGTVRGWDLGTLAPGASGGITLVAQAPADLTGIVSVTNRAVITYAAPAVGDLTPQDNEALDVDYSDLPDLKVFQRDGRTWTYRGQVLTHTLWVTNAGTYTATGVVITEVVPAVGWLQVLDHSPGFVDVGFGHYVRSVGTLPPGASRSFTFVVQVRNQTHPDLPKTQTAVTLTLEAGHATPGRPDRMPADNRFDEVDLLKGVDLVVAKGARPPQIHVGERLTYTLWVTNVGTLTAYGVVLTETLDGNVSFVGPSAWQSLGGGRYRRLLGDLAPGASAQVTLAVQVTATVPPGTRQIVNRARAGEDGRWGRDRDEGDNEAQIGTVLVGPDLQVSKALVAGTPRVGELLTFTLRYTNASSIPATGVVLTDVASPNLLPVEVLPWDRCEEFNPYCLRAVLPEVPPGGTGVLTLTAQVVGGGVLTNAVWIGDLGIRGVDVITPNNVDWVTATVRAAFLVVRKEATPPEGTPVRLGDRITYTLWVTNVGNEPATGVLLYDRIPAFVRVVQAGGGTLSGGELRWSLGALNPGVGAQRTWVAEVTFEGPWVRNAEYGAVADGGVEGRGGRALLHPILQTGALRLQKAGPAVVASCDLVTYTLRYTNTGTVSLAGGVLTDVLPVGLHLASDPAAQGWNGGGGVLTRSLGTLDPGGTGQATLVAQTYLTTPAGLLENWAWLAAGGLGVAAAQEVEVTPRWPDLAVADLQVSPAAPKPGETVVVTVTLENRGEVGVGWPDQQANPNRFCGGGFYVDLYPHRTTPPGPEEYGSQSLWQSLWLGPGERRTLSFSLTYAAVGTYTLYVQVNPDRYAYLPELRYDNNVLGVQVSVRTSGGGGGGGGGLYLPFITRP